MDKMTINERFKYLRKEVLHKTQNEIAKVLDMTHAGVSKIESGNATLTEKNMKIICREFNVNYSWLLAGEGDIFENDDNELLKVLAEKYELRDAEVALLKEFVKLDKKDRDILLKFVNSNFGSNENE